MGLDMNIIGKKFLWTNYDDPEKTVKEDGFRLQEKIFELCYWRKHPNLHGYIVNEFAEGVDECQEIDLSKEDVVQLMMSVSNDSLPPTQGFFFGSGGDPGQQDTIKQLQKALEWLITEEEGVSRSICYKASW